MAFKIYTKTGDRGETSLFGGRRLSKHHLRIDAYGTVDELNAHIGLVRDLAGPPEVGGQLFEIQNRLFVLGSSLACDPESQSLAPDLQTADIEALEQAIDQMEAVLSPLKNFILPGGHPAVSHTHIARCVCRRAERLCVALAQVEQVDPMILQYLNRLSDYLFVLSRYIGKSAGAEEVIWKGRGHDDK
jgi:cob(I)alamin adenosyltransferase